MTSLAIRCHSCTPAATAELTDWLEQRIEELRSTTPLHIRVSYLTSELPSAVVDDGWLLQLDIPAGLLDEELDCVWCALREVVRDMRVLGFSPIVLAPLEQRWEGLSASGLPVALQQAAAPVAGR